MDNKNRRYVVNMLWRVVVVFLLVARVSCQNVTSSDSIGVSKMAWLKGLLDHHDWYNIANGTGRVTPSCADQLDGYIAALNEGQLWASKMFDASGQYSSSALFGNEFWLGSINACSDLQLAQYYNVTPPHAAAFHVARLNVTLPDDHFPQSRVISVGECLPESCTAADLQAILELAAELAETRAERAGLDARVGVLAVRPVPGPYHLVADYKFLIIGSATLVVLLLMLVASFYEGWLERKWRQQTEARRRDLELSQSGDTRKRRNVSPAHDNVRRDNGQAAECADTGDRGLRRATCGLWSEVLLSFSILSNGRTILSTQRPADGALTCLHGMRFLSVIWVIMVHTYLTVFYVADNKTLRTVTERSWLYQSVGNASYSVDTFFFISGLLVTVLFLRTEEKKNAKKSTEIKTPEPINKNMKHGFTNSALSVSVISQSSLSDDLSHKTSKCYTPKEAWYTTKTFLLMVLYRFIRLTPAYGFVIGLTELSLRYVHNISVFEPAIFDHITCDLFWWRNLLYINNLYPQREMCMVWSWYMANDTQFYVLGMLLLLISVKHVKFSMISLGVLLASSWATTVYISVSYQYRARIQEPFEMFDPLYDKPWSRIGPYIIGMAVGWYLHRTKCQIRLPWWAVALGWPVSLAIMASVIFSMVDGYFEVWPTAFYVSIGHTAWGVALAWVTVACCSGHGGLVNSALSYRGLLPLSRLTYCAYLVHPTIMMYITFLMDGPLHLQNSMVLTMYAGFAVMAFLSSFAISLAFEAPAVRLLKIINKS